MMTLQYPVLSAPFGVSWDPPVLPLSLTSVILVPMALAPVPRYPLDGAPADPSPEILLDLRVRCSGSRLETIALAIEQPCAL